MFYFTMTGQTKDLNLIRQAGLRSPSPCLYLVKVDQIVGLNWTPWLFVWAGVSTVIQVGIKAITLRPLRGSGLHPSSSSI